MCGVLTIKREVVSLFVVYFLSEPIFEVRLITCAKECNENVEGKIVFLSEYACQCLQLISQISKTRKSLSSL